MGVLEATLTGAQCFLLDLCSEITSSRESVVPEMEALLASCKANALPSRLLL